MTPTRSLKASSRPLLLLLFIALLIFSLTPNALADEGGKWGAVAERINTNLDQAQKAFESGNVEKAKEHVKEARYGQFVRTGFETEVNAKVSGGDASHADMEFGALGQALNKGDKAKVAKIIDGLKSHIKDNATALDGGTVKAKDLRVSDGKWGQVAQTMNGILDKAVQESKKGNAEAAKDKVNEAYYGHYETTGFEKMTGARVNGARVSSIELEFSLIKKAISEKKTDEVSQRIDQLKPQLIEDANKLDGFDGSGKSTGGSTSIFLGSFLVILREGMEAILVVAAVIAYLVKAGHQNKTKYVWLGAGVALLISIGLAAAFSELASLAGKNQELLEGLTAIVAVAMLIWVSNWMLGKSNQKAWDKFIKDKTDTSLTRGSLVSLAFVAFLAVLREGAETILFYQPVIAMAGDDMHLVWIGLAVGVVCLVIIYALIRIFSVRIPLRPFFIVTSIFLAIMAFTFTGSGIKELQEADALPATPLDGWPTVDLLGIYPRVENLAAQALVLVIIGGLFAYAYLKQRSTRALDETK
ncbi:MAG: FTR1 family protein [Winkia neuii]|uniref:OfeT family oxidase-dependent iron (Fe2+) transporter n=2 Tax=Winkia neuii TaxID=33007 RepID=A0A2I1ILI6_9ACTO|nr:FTR1 family protein [Winkia neuii]OFJ70584.1 OfeT family oxidase-dependent iron (Fe2+) transporter [Actinomyces sp. HMSC064C12]OFK02644.1 OfeT family oxidase-dependent iron (Fe2+) transporter [Actinomyces sp. HMSC072A03]OFT54139.1 OfeT family oxidase-dependent iron (Fe2+) transporter [Actinomyces sp. HMSC06A08]KWZ74759.1 FTR1 family protein [Winkia neuii]MDK8099395.1 FTR1 family protein [Winkia neuii]